MGLDGFTPSMIASLDQEHQQTKDVLTQLVAKVRADYEGSSSEVFINLCEQLGHIQGQTKLVALLSRALMDLAAVS